MASRASLNKVLLIGNLTRDPELRYTPSGAAVCSFGVATNRVYVASDGTKKEETEFIRIVSWNKLAELCSQLLTKGRKVYVEGRLQTRTWETPDGQSKQTTEVVIDDMRILDSKREQQPGIDEGEVLGQPLAGPTLDKVEAPKKTEEPPSGRGQLAQSKKTDNSKKSSGDKKEEVKQADEGKQKEEVDVDLEDLPF